jgi:hypothetical protein
MNIEQTMIDEADERGSYSCFRMECSVFGVRFLPDRHKIVVIQQGVYQAFFGTHFEIR